MKTERNRAIEPSGSKGISAAIAKLIRRRRVIDIVKRFQTKHALQENRETKNLHASTNRAVATGIIR